MQLVGSFGKFALVGGDTRILDIYLEPATQFFQHVAIKKTDVVANELGIYSFLPVGRYGKAKMNSLTVPKHLLQRRTNCLTWNPKGRSYLKTDEIDTFAVEYMGEQCSDSIFGDCLEYVLGTGNQVRDIFATPEGRQLFGQVIDNIYLGLGNSFYDLITFGLDPQISDSDTNMWWDTDHVTTAEWDDFIDQQMGIGVKGHIPLIEDAKAAGLPNFNVAISGAVSGDQYNGSDVTAEFDACMTAAPARFRVLLKQRNTVDAAFLVSKSIFDAYKDYLIATFQALPQSYMYLVNGEPVRGVLMYDGLPVVCMDEWTEHDEMLGINTHRIILTAMGNMSVAHDVPSIDQFGGIGLRMEQSMRLRDKGATYMYTNFRVGAAIADTDFMVNASTILTP